MFGVCNGVIDVTVNVQAVALERIGGRAIMSRLHAMWSLGTVLGALAGAGAIGARCDAVACSFAGVALLIAGLGTVLSGALLGAVADASRAAADGSVVGGTGPTPARCASPA